MKTDKQTADLLTSLAVFFNEERCRCNEPGCGHCLKDDELERRIDAWADQYAEELCAEEK